MQSTDHPINHTWHVRAVWLPEGSSAEDWWLVDGRLTQTPVAGAPLLPGRYLLPGGLVDAHAHLTLDFANTGLPQGSAALIQANWQRQQASGVLALRDAGVTPGAWLADALPDQPVLTAGRLLAPPGHYYAHLATWVKPADLIATALAEVEAGVPWVKVIGDFVGPDGDWFNAPATYEPALIRKLVQAVHAAGARVMAHSTGPSANELVQAGVDSIEHGPSLTAETVQRMADQGVAWVPTVWTMMKNLAPVLPLPGVGAYVQGKVQQMAAHLRLAAELGVPLLLGTDEVPHGAPYLEATTLYDLGLSGAQVLRAASTTARQYLKLPLRVAAPASFVLYEDDPRQTPATLANPAAVIC